MPFFIRKKTGSKVKTRKEKRKLGRKPAGTPPSKKARVPEEDDEEIESDQFDDEVAAPGPPPREPDLSEAELETPQEKRLRLAKLYLEEIERQERSRAEAAEEEDAGRSVADRLREEALRRAGRLQRAVAEAVVRPEPDQYRRLRCRQLRRPLTCAVLAPDDQCLYTGSKDCALIKWCMVTGKRVQVVPGVRKGDEKDNVGHSTHILALAISSDNKYLVSGDQARQICVWSPARLERLHVLRGHRGAVTALAFQRGTHQLFSGSADRSVRVWSVDDRAYIESLFGHQDCVQAVDALGGERAVSCGGRDLSARVWKLAEESQLVFTGHRDSIDCLRLINDQHFVTGGQDGMLALWSVTKKRPLCSVPRAHGCDPASGLPRWVSSVAALLSSDLVASGSHDGCVRLWRCGAGFSTLSPLMALPAAGFVNSLSFSSDGDLLVAGLGQEHRLGRWWRTKEARNQVLVLPLKLQKAAVDRDESSAQDAMGG